MNKHEEEKATQHEEEKASSLLLQSWTIRLNIRMGLWVRCVDTFVDGKEAREFLCNINPKPTSLEMSGLPDGVVYLRRNDNLRHANFVVFNVKLVKGLQPGANGSLRPVLLRRCINMLFEVSQKRHVL